MRVVHLRVPARLLAAGYGDLYPKTVQGKCVGVSQAVGCWQSVDIHIHTHTYTHTHIHTYTYTYTDTDTDTDRDRDRQTDIHTYIYICIYIKRTHTNKQASKQACKHACLHTCIQIHPGGPGTVLVKTTFFFFLNVVFATAKCTFV